MGAGVSSKNLESTPVQSLSEDDHDEEIHKRSKKNKFKFKKREETNEKKNKDNEKPKKQLFESFNFNTKNKDTEPLESNGTLLQDLDDRFMDVDPPSKKLFEPIERKQSYSKFEEFSKQRPKRTATGRRSSVRGSKPISTRLKKNNFEESDSKLKFSWDKKASSLSSDSDEWTYNNTALEGFDVAKFKEVNVGQRISGKKNFVHTPNYREPVYNQMPGVPTYDIVEQQLLASLEREIEGI